MRIIKNINHNYAIAENSSGKHVIVSGKGVGFGPVPRELTDLSVVNRVYYDIDEKYADIITHIPENVIWVSGKIVDRARKRIKAPIGSNIVFTLADHIDFTLYKYRKKMEIALPITNDIRYLYKDEMAIGKYGLKLVNEKFNVELPEEEAVFIALHIINAEEREQKKEEIETSRAIEEVVAIIEDGYGIKINKDTFNYTRFASHMLYLLKRGKDEQLIESDNKWIYQKTRDDYPKIDYCVERIADYMLDNLKIKLTDEEKLYLMMHINRLCATEES